MDYRKFPARSSRWFRPFIEEPVVLDEFDVKRLSSRWWTVSLLLVLSLCGLGVSIYESVVYRSSMAFASVALFSVMGFWLGIFRPRTASVVVVILDLGALACHVVSLANFNSGTWTALTAWDSAAVLLAFVSMVVVLNMPLRHPALSRTDISPPFSCPTKELRSPEDNLTLWQWMSATWMAPLISIGSKRQLHDEDVWFLSYEFQHTHLHEAFRHVTGTVVWRLIKANWTDLFLLTFLAIIELAAQLAVPVMLQQLLQAMEIIEMDKKPAIIWAATILAIRLVSAQSGVFSLWFGRRCYERSRGEMITMLHEKVLSRKIIGAKPDTASGEDDSTIDDVQAAAHDNLINDDDDQSETTSLLTTKKTSKSPITRALNRVSAVFGACIPSRHQSKLPDTKQPASMGKVLNLMRNDVYETSQRFWEFQDLVKKPLGLVFSIILTWRLVGWSCLIGIAAVVSTQIINVFLARLFIRWEKVRRQATDHKLQQISQYVESIRHLRWYGWHVAMLKSVMSARQKELNLRLITFALDAVIKFVNVFASATFPVAVFWAYTALAGKHLRIDVAFSALQLFSILQTNLQDIPNLITVLINASVAVGRIEDFMSEPEIATNNTSDFKEQLQLEGAAFSWPGLEEQVLHKLNLSFPIGLTLVVGPVASGKSALLQALLGELDLREGNLTRPDSPVAYCSQLPWLQSMTIRENILFGLPLFEVRYKQVLEACALLPDLASFQNGDLSPIGENGIGLSGGQKARVALARALYSNAKYLLLDDPISALDQQTAEWIVQKCFCSELLKDRTTILVTHRTDICEGLAIQTIEMSVGRARAFVDGSSSAATNHELKRTESTPQPIRNEQESAAIPEKFEDEEHRAHGGVHLMVYWEYVKAGKLRWWFCVVLACIVWRASFYGQTWFLKEWGEAYKTADQAKILLVQSIETMMSVSGASPISGLFDKFPNPATNVIPWLQILFTIAVLQCLLFVATDIFMVVVTYNSGKTMFQNIMQSISNATFRFYDVTPVGRLMNRITGDVGTVDGAISRQFLNVSWQTVNWIASIVVIASVTPLFLVFSLALTATFVFFFLQFLPTSQSLRRLEMVSLSPLMSNFGALLHGLMTVRAFKAQTQFQSRVITVTDAFQKMDHFYWSLQTWLMYRFDTLSAVSTFILTLLAICSGLSPGLTAIVLIAASKFVYSTHTLCKQYGQLQLDFVSVERVVELLHLEQEPAGSLDPPAAWPNPNGDIVFENVTIRYAPHLPPALQNITMTIPGGSSTAITGRTGSGKSTLALAMLATITPEQGRILVDHIDITKVSKQALRERITFLAQDPILFPGTLRSNLDPLLQHSNMECSSVLERIGGSRFNWTLETVVDVGGKNLSQGQRQLVGLARALLRRSSIIIMDEATASIDLETSREVQRVLRSELAHSTVIGIAHRSGVVEGCDLVVRLANGEVIGVGKPGAVDEADR